MDKTTSSFLKYLIPGLLSVILLSTYIFADGFVIGQKLGSTALGAMGICTPVLSFAYAFGSMFGMGGGSLYSIEIGKNNMEKAKRIFSTCIFFAILISVTFSVLTNIFIYQISYFLGADENNIDFVISYIRCLFCFIPGFFLSSILSCFMRNDGHPNISMVASIVSNVMNVILDFVLVYGTNLGIFGAALATVLCAGLSVLVNFISTYIFRMNIRFSLKSVEPKMFFSIAKNGFSSLLQDSSNGIITFLFIFNAIRLYGTEGSSIYTIIMNWSLIFVSIQNGISQSAQPLISRAYGGGRFFSQKIYQKMAFISSLIAAVFCTVITYLLTKELIDLFGTDNQNVTNLTIDALRIYTPAFFFMSLGILISGIFQSVGKYKQASILQMLRGFIFPLVFSILLSMLFGKIGLWISMPLSELLTGIIALALLRKK